MSLDITVTDMFCGAGGSTTGAVLAGANVKLAINHWKRAIETHNSNYPDTKHVLTDLHEASPRRFPATTILVASPECTNHSLAKGRKRKDQGQLALFDTGEPELDIEAEERSRCTMYTPLYWAEYHNYQAVILENVVDAHLWKPFNAWLQAWDSLEYEFEIVHLNSMHAHPTPQSRDRMYFVAWKKGNRKPNLKITPLAHCKRCEKDVHAIQVWKNPTKRHGKYRKQYFYGCPECDKEVEPYYYPAATAIDWSEPAPRIADRKKPLEQKTLERIAHGLKKFAQQAYLVNMNHSNVRPVPLEEMPFYTQTAYDSTGLAVPPFIMDHIGEYRPRAISSPLSTICAGGNHQSLIIPHVKQYILPYYSNGKLAPAGAAALPTLTTVDRCAVLTHEPDCLPAIEDCGFRMLIPREIQAAMAFPKDYIITGTRREQVKQLGNGVTPPAMKLLMERVIESLA